MTVTLNDALDDCRLVDELESKLLSKNAVINVRKRALGAVLPQPSHCTVDACRP